MKKLIKLIFVLIALSTTKLVALAYQIPPEYRPENQPFGFAAEIPGGEGSVVGIIIILQMLQGGLLYFASPIAIIAIVYAGLQMIINGSSEGFTKAKLIVTWAIAGLLVIILSYSIVRITITLLLEFN
jgi:hypothetical protein